MSANTFFLLLVALLHISQANALQPLGRDCLLECENDGLCEFMADTTEELQQIAQSGGLIQRCRCPLGWGGVICEVPTEKCNMATKQCELSGRPCDKIGQEWTCHCGVADRVDHNFASVVCRRGYTEYCNPHAYTPHNELYFCTNGGKCMTDFLAARESPSDIAVRRKYMDAGCMCNEHFEGERCERLIFEAQHLEGIIDPARFQNMGHGVPSLETQQDTEPEDESGAGDTVEDTFGNAQPNSPPEIPNMQFETPDNADGKGDKNMAILVGVPVAVVVCVAALAMFMSSWEAREERRTRILRNAFGANVKAFRNEMDDRDSPYGNMAKNYSIRSSIFGSRPRSSKTSRRNRKKPRISKRLDQIPEENMVDVALEGSPPPIYSNPSSEMYM